MLTPDRTLRYGPDPDHVADVWVPAEPSARPLVVFIHGGYWRAEYDRTHTRPMAADLRDRGWPVAAIEYRRRAGRPDDLVDDVRAALKAVPPALGAGRVVVAGHSAGGHLALWAAAAAPAPGLLGTIALAPVADLTWADEQGLGQGAVAAFLGCPAAERADLDPVRLKHPAEPVVLAHGDADTDAPLKLSESYVAAHPASRLVVIPGAGHYEVIDPRSVAWPYVIGELAASAGGDLRAGEEASR
ncbi:alpha/beta hydrolase [Saccharomonospora sp. NPDC046836]|uniref:alpha/beta hydrolase family protein n=1 Tax=Saccharomonospora sp. NPDC046836 TaxID=3156921 RepID=UPI0033C67270